MAGQGCLCWPPLCIAPPGTARAQRNPLLKNDHVQSYGNMGLACARLGNRQKPLECLNKALDLDPEYEPALINRLAVERLKDGEALLDADPRELRYYSEFKLRGKSYVQQLADELKADAK